MDKVIKINSKEGGPFTTTSNLINFDIMPDGAYDFTDSYVNLVCSITGVTDADASTGQGVYNPLINYTAKDTTNLAAVAACKIRSLYNVAMVKNCSMTSELQGSLEDIRRVDILRQNLNEYTLTTDEKQSLEYQSLRQLTPRNYLRNSTFRELHNEGTAPSRNVQSRIRIPMSQLFELGKLTAYPAQKMGKTRIHLEMNLDKFAISANLGIPKGSTTFAQFDIVTAPAAGVDVNSLTTKAGVTYIDKTDSPYYVGQKVEVKFSTNVNVGGGADAVGEIPVVATGVGTVTAGADAELQSGGARILVLSSVNASDNAKKITIVGTDINDQSLTATETAANGDFGAHLFKTVSSINLFLADGTTPVTATDTIEINAKAGGAQITATRIISAIAYDDATKKQTLTFNSNLVTGLPSGKVLTVVPVEINTGSTPNEANNVGVLPVKPNNADPATGVITGAKLQVDMAEIVLRKLGAVPKMPAQLNYMSWSTEEFTSNGAQTNFQRMFQLEPNAVNVFMMFPSNDLFSIKDGFDNYRLRLGGPGGNQDLTDRDVIVGGALGKQKDPLYYDRLSMTMLNAGYPMKSMLEQNMNVIQVETGTDVNRRDDAGNLTIVANPVPATPYEKLLQVNMNFAANKGLTELALFKQVMRGVAL